ncbi:MAG: hypothetical protein Q8M76_07770, partial [Spirochaetaceae bacterium]|nr:hypothetical protein [Spirochaetaceae bacterium]
EKLLGPLGIDDWAWEEDGAGITTGGTNFCASAIDLAKLGYLYLRGGDWFGTRLVEPEWIAAATETRFAPKGMNRAEACGYGYLWWIDEWGGYSAHGAGGNFCFVLPRYDLVVVITAGLPDDGFPLPYDLVKRYILPAAEEGGKAGSDPAGDAAFAELTADCGPRAQAPALHPPIADAIGKLRFTCEPNPLDIDWFELDFAEPDRVGVTMQEADAEKAPRSFVAGARGLPLITMSADWGMAATVVWEGEKSLRLTIFDMRAIIDIGIAFDGRGDAAVRASSPAYDMDAAWHASSR